jgi:hypothetical protein
MSTINNQVAEVMQNTNVISLLDRCYNGKANKCCCGCSGNYSEGERAKKVNVNAIIKGLREGTLTFNVNDSYGENSNNICFDTANGRWKVLYFKNDDKDAEAIAFKRALLNAAR